MTLNRLPFPTPSAFTGNPLQFIEWQASFTALIDQKGISASQKFHYLKQYLGCEAREVVEGTFFRTDDNAYAQAYVRDVVSHALCSERSGRKSSFGQR